MNTHTSDPHPHLTDPHPHPSRVARRRYLSALACLTTLTVTCLTAPALAAPPPTPAPSTATAKATGAKTTKVGKKAGKAGKANGRKPAVNGARTVSKARTTHTAQAAPGGRADVTFPFQETFDGARTSGTLTGSAKLDNGWLRLTGAEKDQAGAWQMNESFSSGLGIAAEFTYATHGGNNHCFFTCNGYGDGLTMFLSDGAAPQGTGGTGGGLGYVGLPRAVLGVGFDEYGNFSEGQGGPGRMPWNIVLRGGGTKDEQGKLTGYTYATGKLTPGGKIEGVDREKYRTARVGVVPENGKLLVSVSSNSGPGTPMEKVIDRVDIATLTGQPALPKTLRIGFSGGTGGATNNHDIGQVKVSLPVDVSVTKTGPATAVAGTPVTYTVTAKNDGTNDAIGVIVKDPLNAEFTNASWTCAASAGSACGRPSGKGPLDTTVDLKRNGTVTYKVTATAPPTPQVVSTTAVAQDSAAFTDIDATNNTAGVTTALSANPKPMGQCHSYTYTAVGKYNTKLYRTNPLTGESTDTGIVWDKGFDAMGYSILTDRLYAISRDNFDMLIIDPNTPTGNIKRVPVTDEQGTDMRGNNYWEQGDVTPDGKTYILSGAGNKAGASIDLTAPVPKATWITTPGGGNWWDWAVHPKDGQLYMADNRTLKAASAKVSPFEVRHEVFPGPRGSYRSNFFDEVGNLYAIDEGGTVVQLGLTASTTPGTPINKEQVGTARVISQMAGQDDVYDAGGCVVTRDFADAPDSYGTTYASGGPSSTIDARLTLGAGVTAEADARRPFKDGAVGDYNGLGDSDDALTKAPDLASGTYSITVPITNKSDGLRLGATLAGWLDFNRNGAFDTAERVTTQANVNATSATLTWENIPPTALAKAGTTYLRLRLYDGHDITDPKPTGEFKGLGEVEDYPVTVVSRAADVALAMKTGTDPVVPGTTFAYTLTATNTGPAAATGVKVTDTLPAHLAFVSGDGCAPNGQTVTCGPEATLAKDGTKVWTITVRLAADYEGGDLINTATVASANDPEAANDKATAGLPGGKPAPASADLQMTKTSS